MGMVNPTNARLSRRGLLGGLGSGLVAAALTGCSGLPDKGGSPTPRPSSSAVPTSAANPFGVAKKATVDFFVDGARYPGPWVDALARQAENAPLALQVKTTSTTQLAADLADRFANGTPPELVLSGGPDPLALGSLAPQLTDLTPLLDLTPAGGASVRQRLRPHALADATLGGRVIGIPCVWTVHGLWYSSTLFTTMGWKAPTTWDELAALGEQARAKGLFLFGWGRETATWLLRLALASAVKQGGEPVRRSLDALAPDCWTQKPVQDALVRLRALVNAGLLKPGGATRPWRDAITSWSKDRKVLFVPSGSWIANESGVDAAFGLDFVPDPALDASAVMPPAAVQVQGGEFLVAPVKSAAPAAGLELARLALTSEAATAFCTTNQVLSTLTDVQVAQPGPALQRQTAVLEAAGEHVFALRSLEAYGTNHDFQTLWNGFLMGSIDVTTLTAESQRITDLVRTDQTIAKLA